METCQHCGRELIDGECTECRFCILCGEYTDDSFCHNCDDKRWYPVFAEEEEE